MAEPYNSLKLQHKSPFGAVEAGKKVTLRLLLPRELHCTAAFLQINRDGEPTQRILMQWECTQDDAQEWWRLEYTPQEEGLYWYTFAYETSWGLMYATLNGGSWQLTVYEQNFTTPDWLKGGLIYQIFPDRFYNSGEAKENVPDDRVMHSEWGEQPEWKPDSKGIVRNNDYFGGDLNGITEKLDYISSLGVTCIYLNPIFEAHSNHRYNTADYRYIDPLLGTEDDFKFLCEEAKKYGISVILDGVFSHTGSDSRYFNREKRYDTLGAYQSTDSPYYHWYTFRHFPDKYDSWWGIDTLPEVHEESPDFMEFINGKNGIVRKWLRLGARGWRLDVADELPDGFLDALRSAAKAENPEALVLGEVWEDASNKFSYGVRRRYLRGKQLDSVMNYPFAKSIMDYLRYGSSDGFFNTVLTVLDHYPPQVVHTLMNHIGTHDTQRAMTALAGEQPNGRGRDWQSGQKLNSWQRNRGRMLMRLASAIQYTLPGVPSLYYGDEAGLEGYGDPFNRACYPWGKEVHCLLSWYRQLGRIRKLCPALKDGDFIPIHAKGGVLAYARKKGGDGIFIEVNRNDCDESFTLSGEWENAKYLLGVKPSGKTVTLPPTCCTLLGIGEWVNNL